MIHELLHTFDGTMLFTRQSVADLSDDEMVLQPAGTANPGAWTVGHLIYRCQEVSVEKAGDRWLPADWAARFGTGSTPVSDGARYPSRSELVALLDDSAGRLRAALLGTDESLLAQPLPDPRFREILPTLGHALLQVVGSHSAFHAGRLAVWRRAIRKVPVPGFQ